MQACSLVRRLRRRRRRDERMCAGKLRRDFHQFGTVSFDDCGAACGRRHPHGVTQQIGDRTVLVERVLHAPRLDERGSLQLHVLTNLSHQARLADPARSGDAHGWRRRNILLTDPVSDEFRQPRELTITTHETARQQVAFSCVFSLDFVREATLAIDSLDECRGAAVAIGRLFGA